jgi:subtilisin family serine protease
VFRLNHADSVLAVAAAGNDSWGDGDRFTPRLPAAVEGVLAVSAVAGDGLQASSYSNVDDFFTNNDGLAAFGGEVEVLASDGQVYTTTGNALVGLYSGSDFPGNPQGNTSGLAEWSGTSFATPIAAGIAACTWSEDPTKSAAEIRTALLNIANSNPGDVLPYIQH